MEDLALLVSFIVFVPMLIGALAVGFSIYFVATGRGRTVAVIFSSIVGLSVGFFFIVDVPIAWLPFIPFFISVILIFIRKNSK
jgi:hypothetical protein